MKRFLTILVVGIYSVGCFHQLSAQSPTNDSLPWFKRSSTTGTSVAGGPIVSWPADPFMTAAQEAAILDILNQPSDFPWGPSATVADVAGILAKAIPTFVDERALEEFGLTPEMPLRSAALSKRSRASVGVKTETVEAEKPAFESTSAHWWNPAVKRLEATDDVEIQRPSLLAELLWLFQENEITLQVQANQIVITTKEAALEKLPIRIYDVTSLVQPDESSEVKGPPQPMGPSQRIGMGGSAGYGYIVSNDGGNDSVIMELIQNHIDPTQWEQLGGTGTMSIYRHRDKCWLVVSAVSTVHWEIQALLDQLNDTHR